MAEAVLQRLKRQFPEGVIDTSSDKGNETALVKREQLLDIAVFLRDDPDLAFDMPIDCTCVDWPEREGARFDVVYHLYSLKKGHRVRLKLHVSADDSTCPSLTSVWPGMNWHEREAWDLYGMRFVDHPNLKRVLLYEEFEGHPLRKDFPIDKRTPLIEERKVKEIITQRHAGPEMLNKP